LDLDNLAKQFRGEHLKTMSTSSEIQTSSLERLLWMYLKLLYSVDALDRFLKGTSRDSLSGQLTEAESELKEAQEKKRHENILRSLQDQVATLHQRVENYDRAVENRDYLSLELERIEQKVSVISEMAINSRDTSDFTAQVDGITDGIAATEQAMRTLDVGPMLTREDPPPLLQRQEPPPLLSQKR
jgi:DNA repair ATPase RecN